MTLLWSMSILLPVLLTGLILLGGRFRALGLTLIPFATVPALIASLVREPGEPVIVEWLLLGTTLGLDITGQLFLLVTALLWGIAGIYARTYHRDDPNAHRFFVFFLVTLTGNLGLVLAQDVVTFYVMFTLMTFSAYGLIIHEQSRDALKAGRVYIVLAVFGEAFLLSGLVLAVYPSQNLGLDAVAQQVAESPDRNVTIALLLAGFGVKAGTIPLHVWLPLAHPVAPTPASAVLSGAMIKAGLLGWLRFLPLGEGTFADWGLAIVLVSVTAAFFGVVLGMTQDDPKTLLAYSSISQMGFMTSVVGVGLAAPEAWDIALIGCATYALHHGLTKGVLFLGVGVAHETGDDRLRRWLVMAGLIIASLSLAGAPLGTGALAKEGLKEGIHAGPSSWETWLEPLLLLAAAGTTLLVGRFCWLIWRNELGHDSTSGFRGLAVPWALLLVVTFPIVWSAPAYFDLPVDSKAAFKLSSLWSATWPVLAGGAILASLWLLITRTRVDVRPVQLPAGDLLIPIEWMLAKLRPVSTEALVPRPPDPAGALSASWYGLFARSDPRDRTSRFGRWLVRWDVAGTFITATITVFVILMIWS